MQQIDFNPIESYLIGDWYIDCNYGLKRLLKYQASLATMGSDTGDMIQRSVEISKPKTRTFDIKGKSKTFKAKRIKFQDVMISDDNLCMVGVDSLIDELNEGYQNAEIKGILLEMNTGGGEVEAALRTRSAIQMRNKPVVVWSSMFASGGVYATLDADERISNGEMARFGSIGVLISLNKSFLSFFKDRVLSLYSEKSPDKNKLIREILKDNHQPMIEDLTKMDDVFMDEVEKALNLNEKLKNETLAGGMFLAKSAKKRGLIDAIGNEAFAIRRLQSIIKNS